MGEGDMANDRLRDALNTTGLTPGDVANDLGVDPKTIERWITVGRVPYPRHRHRLAALVRESEAYLWPDAIPRERRGRIAESEIVHVYPHRADVPADLWRRLFTSARDTVDVLVYSGLFLPEQQPRLLNMLRDKATAGARIRILLGDPDCQPVAQRGQDEGIGDAMAAKIRNVLSHYRPLAGHDGIDVRLHATTLYNSLYRFDNELLVNAHIYSVPASHAPVMHLRRLSGGDLFDTYAEAFNRIWTNAVSAWPQNEAA